MKKLTGNASIIEEYEKRIKPLYSSKATSTRKSALRQAIIISCNGNCDAFVNLIKNRSGYIKIIDAINDTNSSSKAKYINAVNVYKNVFNIDYANEEQKVKDLIKIYGDTVNKIIEYSDIIRTGNIIGEYAEYLCERFLKVKRSIESNKNVDGVLDGKEVQIKARWVHSGNSGEKEFGEISLNNNNEPYFDYFIGFSFNKDITINKVFILDKENIKKLFDSLKRKRKKILLSDIFDKDDSLKNGLSLVTKYDKEINELKNFANN